MCGSDTANDSIEKNKQNRSGRLVNLLWCAMCALFFRRAQILSQRQTHFNASHADVRRLDVPPVPHRRFLSDVVILHRAIRRAALCSSFGLFSTYPRGIGQGRCPYFPQIHPLFCALCQGFVETGLALAFSHPMSRGSFAASRSTWYTVTQPSRSTPSDNFKHNAFQCDLTRGGLHLSWSIVSTKAFWPCHSLSERASLGLLSSWHLGTSRY